ncbi:MAG: pyruvate kinase [Candidatus Dormibacteraceae bacterium]
MLSRRQRRTRIVCTLGPASVSPRILRRLIAAGMDVARLNFSHGDEATHRRTVEDVRRTAAAAGRQVALLQDLQGPKIRTGALAGRPVHLERRQRVVLEVNGGAPGTTPSRGREADLVVQVSHPELIEAIRPRDRILIADGQIELRARSVGRGHAVCRVVRGGRLRERQGVSLPGRALELPALTAKDLADLRLGAELGFDYVALSFVRTALDIVSCREAVGALGWDVPIIAKLEKREALRHLGAILDAADAVMVARGDLGVELSLGEVPAVQKDVIARANRAGKPVITATEMLESMVTSTRPTRAETSDVANAIWDGTDAVMLSQETSIGQHPVESVRAMAAICRAAENHPAYQRERPFWNEPGSTGNAIAHAAAAVAEELDARAIVALTETGGTALRVSKAHSAVPLIAASPSAAVLRRTALYSGAVPLEVRPGRDTAELIANAVEAALRAGHVRSGDRLVVAAGVMVGESGQTNLLEVETVA